MVAITAASIALPGSIGTFTELMVAWNVAFVSRFNGATPCPVVAVGSVWQELIALATARLATDGTLVACVPDVDAAVATVAARLG
jgi:predicted Rossmann-fold nucleotide-binding protein